ncbi:MAG: tyrosine-protein phosphatase [Bacteroidaceae bacterium]|jgi:protein tyrosine/serine phosphatase
MFRTCLLVSAVTAGLSAGCTSYKPSILAACEESPQSAILKWETFPVMTGELKVYASSDPNNIPLEKPIATTNISEQMLMVETGGSVSRQYYTMVFNDEFPITIASRKIYMPGVQNFRDVGGYFTSSGREVKWGKVYRSDALDSIGKEGERILRGLGVKTVIDLRSPAEIHSPLKHMEGVERINVPLIDREAFMLMDRVCSGTLGLDSLRQMILRMNVKILEEHSKELQQVFEILENEDSYPLVIECNSGKMRTGLVMALLLNALGVGHETVVQDYELSNSYFHIPVAYRSGYSMPEDVQEVITALYTSHAEYLDDIYDYIVTEYDGVENYLRKKVGVSPKELKHLRQLLLTKPDD